MKERMIVALIVALALALVGGFWWGEIRYEGGLNAGIYRGMRIQKGASPTFREVLAIVDQKIAEIKHRDWVLRRMGVSGSTLNVCPYKFERGPVWAADKEEC